MGNHRILFAFQEIFPYLKDSHMAKIGRYLPQGIQEKNNEIRTFMPRFGCINERRNQLHEVIRLSGMNIIIDDKDNPLIIKVASIQSARMQVYFIDNEEYFERKYMLFDKENKPFKDNDERMIFFCRGVLETVIKLSWSPTIISAHGWMSSLLPVYLKTAFSDNPFFSDTKVVFTIYDESNCGNNSKNFPNKLETDGMTKEQVEEFRNLDYIGIMKKSIDYSDGVVIGSENIHPELKSYIDSIRDKKPVMDYPDEDNFIDMYSDFFDSIQENVLV